MVQLRQEMHNFLVLEHLALELAKRACNQDVIHLEPLILLVVILFFLQGLHQGILLAEEHLLTGALDQDLVHFVRQHEDVIQGHGWDLTDLELELLDSLL